MAIDTLLGLLSQSFNVFKKSIKTIIPVIILYTIIYNIFIGSIFPIQNLKTVDDLLSLSDSIGINFPSLLLVIFINVLYYVIIIKYIFVQIKSLNNNILNIGQLFYLFISVILISIFSTLPAILILTISVNSLFILLAILSFIILYYFVFLFVPYIMIDKEQSFQNSIFLSYVLAKKYYSRIILFGVFYILFNIILMFISAFISLFISAISPSMGLLSNQVFLNTGSYLLLTWFAHFYIYLSKK